MTALMKYLAVLGFAGALSLAATTSFAQNVSGSACGAVKLPTGSTTADSARPGSTDDRG